MDLKELRLKCQKTQQEIAQLVGAKRSTYSMWESGKAQPPLHKIFLLASAMNVSPGEIVSCILGDTANEF